MGWDDGVALFDWCEPNYVHTPHVAETWNTITAAPYILIGVATIMSNWSLGIFNRLRYVGAMLVVIGVGTADFHGTLSRRGQAVDELAILYWEVALLFTVFEEALKSKPVYNYAIVALFVLENAMYFQMDSYPQVGWAAYHPLHVLVDIVVVVGLYRQGNTCKRTLLCFQYGLGLILASVVCWLGDMFMCDMTQALHLHALGWHMLSSAAIACLHIGLAVQICRQNKRSGVRFLGFDVGHA